MAKLKRPVVNLLIALVSVALALLICEFNSRVVLNPADYLSVERVRNDILGQVPTASSGFDGWGFRNPRVPKTADIVAVGDSHTYGNTARMEDSWPYALGRLTGQSVYNLGMGGYGPNQFYYLLQTKALRLKPQVVVCDLYMGDAFDDAFRVTYELDHWAYLRRLPGVKLEFEMGDTQGPPPTWNRRMRQWLSQHSVVYQILFHASFLGRLQGDVQITDAHKSDPLITTLSVPDKNVLEAFHPKYYLTGLDQEKQSVREGMRITFELFKQMNELCHQNHVRFVVVVIPTKEMVFADYLEHRPNLPLSDELDELIANERVALGKTFQFFTDSNISYVDTLPALKASAQDAIYARSASDMHPNKSGYRVIAQAVFDALKEGQGRN
jgi:hypothetical protein